MSPTFCWVQRHGRSRTDLSDAGLRVQAKKRSHPRKSPPNAATTAAVELAFATHVSAYNQRPLTTPNLNRTATILVWSFGAQVSVCKPQKRVLLWRPVLSGPFTRYQHLQQTFLLPPTSPDTPAVFHRTPRTPQTLLKQYQLGSDERGKTRPLTALCADPVADVYCN